MTSLEEAVARGDTDRPMTIMETLINTEGLTKSDVATMVLDLLFAGIDTVRIDYSIGSKYGSARLLEHTKIHNVKFM